MPLHQRIFYGLSLIITVGGLLYSLEWMVVDIGVRLGVWPREGEFDAYAFTETLSIWNDIGFYTAIIMGLAALILLIRRRALALPAYVLALLGGLTDWVALTGNPFFDGGLDALFLFPAQLINAIIMVFLVHWGVLTWTGSLQRGFGRIFSLLRR